MKRIRLKAPVVIKGFPNVQVGEVVEIPNHDAQVLIGMGVAELVGPEEKPDGLTTGRGVVEMREPEVATRDPEPQPESPKPRRKPHAS
jgi:hypothetical protein